MLAAIAPIIPILQGLFINIAALLSVTWIVGKIQGKEEAVPTGGSVAQPSLPTPVAVDQFKPLTPQSGTSCPVLAGKALVDLLSQDKTDPQVQGAITAVQGVLDMGDVPYVEACPNQPMTFGVR